MVWPRVRPGRKRVSRRGSGLTARGLVGAVALAATLGACGSERSAAGVAHGNDTPVVVDAPAPEADRVQTPRPRPGDCWDGVDTAVAEAWTTWEGPSAIPCDEPHTSITVDVVDLGADFERAAPVHRVEVLGVDEAAVVRDACYAAIDRTMPGEAFGTRVQPVPLLPAWPQWLRGERWLRCDVVVGGVDTTWSGGAFEELPERAGDVIDAAYTQYLACYDAPGLAEGMTVDADLSLATYVPCDGSEEWRYGQAFEVATDEYPGLEKLADTIAPSCEAQLQTASGRTSWQASIPSAEAWAAGSRMMICWLT